MDINIIVMTCNRCLYKTYYVVDVWHKESGRGMVKEQLCLDCVRGAMNKNKDDTPHPLGVKGNDTQRGHNHSAITT